MNIVRMFPVAIEGGNQLGWRYAGKWSLHAAETLASGAEGEGWPRRRGKSLQYDEFHGVSKRHVEQCAKGITQLMGY